MTKRGIEALFLALALAACGGDATPEPAPEPEVEATHEAEETAEVEVEEPAGPSADEIPVADDFTEAVEAEITADNFEDELARLEAELDGE
ncbi:MAG: hypothetical protein AAF447_15500 [Myxococcota bacterium]